MWFQAFGWSLPPPKPQQTVQRMGDGLAVVSSAGAEQAAKLTAVNSAMVSVMAFPFIVLPSFFVFGVRFSLRWFIPGTKGTVFPR